MKQINLSEWVRDTFSENLSEVAVVTLRADGTVINGAAIRQSPWSQNATGSINLLVKALDRTVAQLGRGKYKDMKFVAFLGGEKNLGVAGHFHGVLQFPANAEKQEFMYDFDRLWSMKVSEALKATLKTSVFFEPIVSKEVFSNYCSRYEGPTFSRGLDKVVVSRSLTW